MDDLKPCPFCGNKEPRLVHAERDIFGEYYCVCDDCDTWQALSETKQEAIDAWNRRINEH